MYKYIVCFLVVVDDMKLACFAQGNSLGEKNQSLEEFFFFIVLAPL